MSEVKNEVKSSVLTKLDLLKAWFKCEIYRCLLCFSSVWTDQTDNADRIVCTYSWSIS